MGAKGRSRPQRLFKAMSKDIVHLCPVGSGAKNEAHQQFSLWGGV
jgi:hypothetical protein